MQHHESKALGQNHSDNKHRNNSDSHICTNRNKSIYEGIMRAGPRSGLRISLPVHESMNFTWIPIVASIMIGALGGIGLYLAFAKDVKFIEQKEYDLTKLTDEEKQVFYHIQKEKKGVYQSTLTQELDMTKVKITRLLDRLESSGLVERKRRGLTNIVVVK